MIWVSYNFKYKVSQSSSSYRVGPLFTTAARGNRCLTPLMSMELVVSEEASFFSLVCFACLLNCAADTN